MNFKLQMIEALVRICGWISAIFYLIMSVVAVAILFFNDLDLSAMVTLLIFAVMSFTGWNVIKFKSTHYKRTLLVKFSAILSLIFGIFFIFLSPLMFASVYGIGDSYESIIVLLLMFTPSVVSSIAILTTPFSALKNVDEKR